MPLAPGDRIGPYDIVAPLGAGGMGEVYRARDNRLRREVAIKVLPPSFAMDRERLQRFEREAQTLAALNHPHIAGILGLEDAGNGTRALVMELVPGEDLTATVGRGPLPWRDALAIARQIADGLEAAHERGIVHRDLKPANIKLSDDGSAKILDFGLAKAVVPEATGGALNLSHSPTITHQATQTGVILGTAAYMAPEQARGRFVDRRADIWSFGCVLYELLTGRRAFDGDEVTDVLARVIEREPDWTRLAPGTPPELRRLLMRCLTKDAKARLRDIGEARITIDALLSGDVVSTAAPAPAPEGAPAIWTRVLPWVTTAALAIAAGYFALRGSTAPPARTVQVEIALPGDIEFYSTPSLSADGTKMAFVGVRSATRQIFTRSLDETEFRAVPGTETASAAAIAPDGLSAVFVTPDTRVSRVVFSSGLIERVAEGASVAVAPTASGNGLVIFSRGPTIVAVGPNTPERELAKIDAPAGETALSWPIVSVDDRTVFFVSRRKGPTGVLSRIEAVALTGGARHTVVDGGVQPMFASADRIVFVRDATLFVARYDSRTFQTTGEPARVNQAVGLGPGSGASVAIARSGALFAASPDVFDRRLAWVSMTGAERLVRGPSRRYLSPRVSPDGSRIAFADTSTIWTLDPERDTFTRVTTATDPVTSFPIWSNDSRTIYYRSGDGVRAQNADGSGSPALLPNTGPTDYPNALTPDDQTLILQRIDPVTAGDLYSMPTRGGPLTPILVTSAYEAGAQLSRDGKWLAYVSNESGKFNIYLRPFGGPDRKWPVSNQGGTHPLWSNDGRRIFYRSGNQVLAVDVTTSPDVRLGEPRVLFERGYAFGQSITLANESVSHDGTELLMVKELLEGRHLNLVLNWLPNLR